MNNKSYEDKVLHQIETVTGVGENCYKFNEHLAKCNKENDDNIKSTLLNNLEIANKMFDKKADIIFHDEDLRLKAESLFNKIKKYI